MTRDEFINLMQQADTEEKKLKVYEQHFLENHVYPLQKQILVQLIEMGERPIGICTPDD
jgi:hypothetical protein